MSNTTNEHDDAPQKGKQFAFVVNEEHGEAFLAEENERQKKKHGEWLKTEASSRFVNKVICAAVIVFVLLGGFAIWKPMKKEKPTT